ncbi:hypothetical protein U1Q18_002180 [Sarracenia purpurea var. burkii]
MALADPIEKISLSHNGTCIWIVITEECGEALNARIGAWQRLRNVLDEAWRCLLVISLRDIRIIHQIVWNVGPNLCFLSSAIYCI